jgi:hypothetical protein
MLKVDRAFRRALANFVRLCCHSFVIAYKALDPPNVLDCP